MVSVAVNNPTSHGNRFHDRTRLAKLKHATPTPNTGTNSLYIRNSTTFPTARYIARRHLAHR